MYRLNERLLGHFALQVNVSRLVSTTAFGARLQEAQSDCRSPKAFRAVFWTVLLVFEAAKSLEPYFGREVASPPACNYS